MDNPWGLGVGNWESFGNWELAVGNSRRHTSCKCLRLVPTIAANADRWTKHDWVGRGDEWSPGGSHAGTDLLWWRTLLPRIRTLLPARRILEIGPGYGRWTDYLRTSCEHLIAIDVTPACIESCRERFAGDPRLEFHVNDGTSLDAAGTGSVDFVFSFDSLVHAEGDVLDRYVEQFARILAPDGAVFVHHSNLGAFVDPETHDVQPYVTKRHWRATSMTARRMRDAARRAGLECVTQELINWIGRGRTADRPRLEGRALPLTDCLSIVMRPIGDGPADTRILCNRTFVDEWRQTLSLAAIYTRRAHEGSAVTPAPAGPRRRSDVLKERAHKELAGRMFVRLDPIAPALRARRCPDCRTTMTTIGGRTSSCAHCQTQWSLL